MQLFLVVKDPEDPLRRDATALSAFPAYSLMEVFENYEDSQRRLKSLISDLKKRGFKWYTLGDKDPSENVLGEPQVYDPDCGYLGFSDQWLAGC